MSEDKDSSGESRQNSCPSPCSTSPLAHLPLALHKCCGASTALTSLPTVSIYLDQSRKWRQGCRVLTGFVVAQGCFPSWATFPQQASAWVPPPLTLTTLSLFRTLNIYAETEQADEEFGQKCPGTPVRQTFAKAASGHGRKERLLGHCQGEFLG